MTYHGAPDQETEIGTRSEDHRSALARLTGTRPPAPGL